MRQALGLFGQRAPQPDTGGSGRQGGGGHMQVGARRHRFVQDGEVPVSVVRGRRDQVASAPAARADTRDRLLDEQAAERAGREQAERRLAETQAALRTLQTRLGHAELERDEAVNEAKSLREQLLSERAEAEVLRAQVVAASEMPPERHDVKMVASKVSPEPAMSGPEREPEPVKWWL